MGKMITKLSFAVLMIVSLIGLPLASVGCAPKEAALPAEGAPTGPIGEVHLAEINDLTGPTSASCRPHHDFLIGCSRYWNDQGGLLYNDPNTGKEERVLLKWDWGDNKAQAGPCPTIYKRLMLTKPVFMFLGSSAAVSSVGDWCNRDEVTAMFGAPPYEPRMEQLKWCFCPQPPHYSSPAFAAQWMLEDWQRKGNSGTPKLAWYTLDIPYGRTVLRPEPKGYIEETLGIEIVGEWFIPWRPTDCSTELLAMVEAGANYCYGSLVVSQEYMIMKDMQRLGLKDKLQIVSCPYGITEKLIELAGAEAANGIVGVYHAGLPLEWDKTGVKFARELAAQYDLPYECDSLTGTAVGLLVVEVVKRALEANGYPITSDDVRVAFESVRTFETGGCYPPFTFTPTEHRGCMTSRMITVKDGKIVELEGYRPHPDLTQWVSEE